MPDRDAATGPSGAQPLTGRSYWQRHGGAPPPRSTSTAEGNALATRPLDSPVAWPATADFAVVGGGFAGLTTAIRLAEAEPTARIVLLEAQFLGFGASGRNGGLMSPLAAPIWLASADRSSEHAWGIRELNARIHRTAAWLAEAAPGSEVQPTHLRLEAAGRMTDAALGKIARTLARCGLDHQERVSVRARQGGKLALRELLVPTHIVNPYKTVLALASVAQRLGVDIREWSPVMSVVDADAGVGIAAADGRSMTAGTAVISTNAYSSELRLPPGMRAKAKPVYNYMIATPELTPGQEVHVPADLPFVVELNKAYVFYRRYAGRLVFGGIDKFSKSGDDDFAVPPVVLAALRRHLAATFPGSGLGVSEAWGGRFHMSLTDMPQIERRGRIVMNVGYGGTGVALALVCADLAAGVARGKMLGDGEDRRLLDAIVGTRLPIVDGLRFAGSVAAGLLRPGGARPDRT